MAQIYEEQLHTVEHNGSIVTIGSIFVTVSGLWV